jgi:NAD(P)-dependent dehydrogenase (short-subunit alcohol dehydrogenase family)
LRKVKQLVILFGITTWFIHGLEGGMAVATAVATAVVTGASSGVGRAIAADLCGRGWHVIGVGRSAARCAEAEAGIRRAVPQARLTYCVADLGSQRQLRALAAQILAHSPRLEVLIHNAAEVPSWYQATEDGYERQFAVNHLAPFLLTHDLAPALSAAGRVVTVTSGSHRGARLSWPDVMLRRRYHPLRAYRQTKLANVLFTYELNRRRAAGPTVEAFAADPGLVDTALGSKGTSGLVRWVWERRRRGGVPPATAAAGVVFLATDAGVRLSDGAYWKDRRPVRPSRESEREDEAARLWELSERLCGVRFGEPASSQAEPS